LSERRRFPGIRRLLSAFERRLLSLLLLYGTGRVLLSLTGLLLALFALDRLFEPPVWFRLVLLAVGIYGVGKVAFRTLLVPLRERPDSADLAALLERFHPGMRDLLATAVEVNRIYPGESRELKEAAAEQAEQKLSEIDLRVPAPSGVARRSATRGMAGIAVLLVLAWLQPTEARIFFDRLFGGTTPWPQATTLVMLEPYAGGEQLPLEELTPDLWRLQVAQGTALTLRIRADGVVPDQVIAEGPRGRRNMQSVGDGEFILRLPALEGDEEWRFEGGDDDDGTPLLQIAPGYAPTVAEWLVQVAPPEYTGQASFASEANEYRVPQGSRLAVRFVTDLEAAEVSLRNLDGSRQTLQAIDGAFEFSARADRSGEIAVELVGKDGFRNANAAVLRWQAEPDAKPSLRFLFPSGRWSTVAGGRIPLVVQASDDYGLASVLLREDGAAEGWELALGDDPTQLLHQELRIAPEPSAENFGADFRMRFLAQGLDQASPLPQAGDAQTPWVEVLSPASFEEQLGERMVRVRERVEDLIERLQPILEGSAGSQLTPLARRMDRELEGLTVDLEQALLERIFAGLDRGSGAIEPIAADLVRNGLPPAGATVAAMRAPGVPALLDRAALLLQLAGRMQAAGGAPATALREATLAGKDPVPAAQELDKALRAVLDDLLAWEDFQSAVDLLRGLLDRQRSLYLRTQEASGR
jgi:hypothetical protein